jgi:hypothetical protein
MLTITFNNQTTNLVLPIKNVNEFLRLIGACEFEHKTYRVGQMPLEDLPADIQKEVRNTLTVFNQANVVFEYGKYHVSAHTCIKAHYNYDHFVCGTYKADEVYTKEERRQHLAELNNYDFPEWAW